MRFLVLMMILVAYQPLIGQNFIEDFEADNLNDWEVLSGIAQLVPDPTVAGNQSLRLWDRETVGWPESIMIHREFSGDFGVYSYYARADGSQSDADFYFQYTDLNNHYHISHKARGTDNPEFLIYKVVDGIYTELHRQDAIEELGVWVYIRVERYCDGRLVVEFNNDEIIDIIETDIMTPGTIGLRSWSQDSYFDRIEFEPDLAPVYNVERSICIGQEVVVGSNVYDTSGVYLDTLSSASGCDSIVQLELELVQQLESNTEHVLCRGDVVDFGGQLIDAPGAYSEEFVTLGGCDSIVNLNVVFASEFSLGPDRSICGNEGIALSAGNQYSYLWSDGSSNSTLDIDREGTYGVEIVDFNSCTQSDSIEVYDQCELVLYTPTAFSPNGDAIHDEWKPIFDIYPNEYSLSIYDRWGNLHFQSDNPDAGWDGNLKNRNANGDVYVWHIVADNQSFTGDLTIIR